MWLHLWLAQLDGIDQTYDSDDVTYKQTIIYVYLILRNISLY